MEASSVTMEPVPGSTETIPEDLWEYFRLQVQCRTDSSLNVTRRPNETYCEPHHDSFHCWYATKSNTTVTAPCPAAIGAPDHVVAYRHCGSDGYWKNITDYQQCIDFLDKMLPPQDVTSLTPSVAEHSRAVLIMRDIYFGCSLVSLFFLCITLFVFCYFRSLQCSRVSIHKHLVVSFILRFIVIVILFEPLVFGHDVYYTRVDWVCKTIIVLGQYTMVSNIFWMFVEGLFLHNSIVVTVFSTDAPFKIFCAIGWGLPGIIAISWAIAMHFTVFTPCWQNNSDSPYSYIVSGSILLALIVNLFFLINIIRVLVTKLRAHNTHESSRIKKAIRATVILMPLLGLTNLIMLFNPNDGGSYASVYQVTNVVLHSNQGILISIFYCFLNGEVRRVIKQKYRRMKIQRILKNSSRRYSRTSSCILSQTETRGDQSSSSDSNICMGNLNNNSYQKVTLITEVREKPRSENNLTRTSDVIKQTASASDPSNLKVTHSVKFRLSSSENDLQKCKMPFCEISADDVFDLPLIEVSGPDSGSNGVNAGIGILRKTDANGNADNNQIMTGMSFTNKNNVKGSSNSQSMTTIGILSKVDVVGSNNSTLVKGKCSNNSSESHYHLKEVDSNSISSEIESDSDSDSTCLRKSDCGRTLVNENSYSKPSETDVGKLQESRWSLLSSSDFKLNIVGGFAEEVKEEFLRLIQEKDLRLMQEKES
ncbi:vasoactive intestinal polypeptide receptor-like [Saccostrea echinata]|uniref:vasoactive intestinal polypeptide receptor-like n=1 Tax=Saccostrea echinata TaxID=191078 RepID=UPI002A810589|nr:vasoactive intestinal polypeptide receptor-like [Saccostrea echinata]